MDETEASRDVQSLDKTKVVIEAIGCEKGLDEKLACRALQRLNDIEAVVDNVELYEGIDTNSESSKDYEEVLINVPFIDYNSDTNK